MRDPVLRDPVLRELCDLLAEAGATVTFSAHCRSGVIGKLCRCWRCRGESGPTADESAAARDAKIADLGAKYGREVEGRMLASVGGYDAR